MTGLYGLVDMSNKFQRIMDMLVGKIATTHCYLDDILIATIGTACEHSKIVFKVLKSLDNEGLSIK